MPSHTDRLVKSLRADFHQLMQRRGTDDIPLWNRGAIGNHNQRIRILETSNTVASGRLSEHAQDIQRLKEEIQVLEEYRIEMEEHLDRLTSAIRGPLRFWQFMTWPIRFLRRMAGS